MLPAIILFMTGTIALIVGATRVVSAIRSGSFERPSLPVAAWTAISLYGLVLATVGIAIGR